MLPGPIYFLTDGSPQNVWSGVLAVVFCAGSLLLAAVFFRRRLYPLGGAAILLAVGAWLAMGALGQSSRLEEGGTSAVTHK